MTDINNQAFDRCSNLKSVTVKDLYAWFNISFGVGNSNPLYYAKNLYLIQDGSAELVEELVIPDGITAIGQHAMQGCTSITSVVIPVGVSSIGERAFEGCSNLSSVNVPDTVTTVGAYAFKDCSALNSVIISDLGKWCEIDFLTDKPNNSSSVGNPLSLAKNLYILKDGEAQSVTQLIIPEGTTSIKSYAFYKFTGFNAIVIPESVTSVGTDCFSSCTGLRTIYYGGTAEQWTELNVKGDYYLSRATVYYYSETEPTTDGKFWHFDGENVVIW